MRISLKFDYNNCIAVFIVLMPIVNIYMFPLIPGMAIGELIGIVILPIIVILGGKLEVSLSYPLYWLFVLYMALSSISITAIIAEYSWQETFIRIIKTIFYTVIVFYIIPMIDRTDLVIRAYIVVCGVAAVYLLLQYGLYILADIRMPVVISDSVLMVTRDLGYAYNDLYYQQISFRPAGFFTEPAAFCQYTIFSVPLILFRNNKNIKDDIFLVLIIIAILASRSALGLVCIAFLFVLWAFKDGFKINIASATCVVLTMIAFFLVSVKTGIVNSAIERILTVHETSATTGTLRLLRGLIIYKEMPFVHKVFGIGAGNYSAFIEHYKIYTFFDSIIPRDNEYMNMFSTILVYGGGIGFALYIIAIKHMMKNTNLLKTSAFLIFMLFGVSSNLFYSATYLLPMFFLTMNDESYTGIAY